MNQRFPLVMDSPREEVGILVSPLVWWARLRHRSFALDGSIQFSMRLRIVPKKKGVNRIDEERRTTEDAENPSRLCSCCNQGLIPCDLRGFQLCSRVFEKRTEVHRERERERKNRKRKATRYH